MRKALQVGRQLLGVRVAEALAYGGDAGYATRAPKVSKARYTKPPGKAVAPAEPKWQPVRTSNGQLYYWNRLTDETTALGEPRPGSEGRQIAVRQAPSTGAALLSLVAAGAGIGFVFALFGRMF